VPVEGVHRLVHERHPIGEKQNALRPVAAHQQVGERDHRACLAGAGGHHEQRFAIVVALERFADAAYRSHLVMALDDRAVDLRIGEALAGGATLDQELELGLLVEALGLPRRVERVVPDPVVVAVRVEDHRTAAVLLLEAVGVQLGLTLAVVDEALALLVRHAGDRQLTVACLVERPAGLLQEQVDEVVAGLGFGVVVRIWLCGRRRFGLRHFGAK